MKTKLLFLIIMMSAMAGFSQNGEISIEKSAWGTKFYQNGKLLNYKGLQKAVSNNEEALAFAKKAGSNNTAAAFLTFPGGFLIGYPLGQAIGGGQPNWELAAIGAGLILVSIPLSSAANKNAKKSISIYNASLKDKVILQKKHKAQFNLGLTSNGVGVVMRF